MSRFEQINLPSRDKFFKSIYFKMIGFFKNNIYNKFKQRLKNIYAINLYIFANNNHFVKTNYNKNIFGIKNLSLLEAKQ